MLATVLVFALITSIFELVLLMKFMSRQTLSKRWVQYLCHAGAFTANIIVHWGTIVGTMTAITAGLVSFATVPAALFMMAVAANYNARKGAV